MSIFHGKGQPITPALPTTEVVNEMCRTRESTDRMRIQVTQLAATSDATKVLLERMGEIQASTLEVIRQGNQLLTEIAAKIQALAEASDRLAETTVEHATKMESVRQAVEEDVRERRAARGQP